MSDPIEQAGSWAQNDVIQVLNENGVLPRNVEIITTASLVLTVLSRGK